MLEFRFGFVFHQDLTFRAMHSSLFDDVRMIKLRQTLDFSNRLIHFIFTEN